MVNRKIEKKDCIKKAKSKKAFIILGVINQL